MKRNKLQAMFTTRKFVESKRGQWVSYSTRVCWKTNTPKKPAFGSPFM